MPLLPSPLYYSFCFTMSYCPSGFTGQCYFFILWRVASYSWDCATERISEWSFIFIFSHPAHTDTVTHIEILKLLSTTTVIMCWSRNSCTGSFWGFRILQLHVEFPLWGISKGKSFYLLLPPLLPQALLLQDVLFILLQPHYYLSFYIGWYYSSKPVNLNVAGQWQQWPLWPLPPQQVSRKIAGVYRGRCSPQPTERENFCCRGQEKCWFQTSV